MDRIERIQQMLKEQPNDGFLQHALALEWIKRGDDEAAESCFTTLLAAQPDYLGAYYHLRKLYERTERIVLALQWFEKGMKMATEQGDRHAFNELRSAYDELI